MAQGREHDVPHIGNIRDTGLTMHVQKVDKAKHHGPMFMCAAA
jgi:hypothetical protein